MRIECTMPQLAICAAAYLPRVLPCVHNGFGQDAEWVTSRKKVSTPCAASGRYEII